MVICGIFFLRVVFKFFKIEGWRGSGESRRFRWWGGSLCLGGWGRVLRGSRIGLGSGEGRSIESIVRGRGWCRFAGG